MRDDPIRALEIQLGIPLPPVSPKHTCRFCGHQSTKSSHATRHLSTCKHRSEYLASLQTQATKPPPRTQRSSVVNNSNNTNSNNTVNNTVNINCLGEENLTYITQEVVRRLMRTSRSDEEAFANIVNMIHANPQHPENHNIVYTNAKSTLVRVKRGPSFEIAHIDDVTGVVTTKTLDHVVLSPECMDLDRAMQRRLEDVCDNDEMNKKTKSRVRLSLYHAFKNGTVQLPEPSSAALLSDPCLQLPLSSPKDKQKVA